MNSPSAAEVLFSATPAGNLLLDAGAQILCANEAFAQLVGQPLSQLSGRHFASLAEEGMADDLRARLDQLMRGEVDTVRMDVCFEPEPFSEVWADVAMAVHRGSGAAPASIAVTALDCRERRRQDQQAAQRYGMALQAAGLGHWEWFIGTGAFHVDVYWAMTFGHAVSALAPTIDMLRQMVHPEDLAGMTHEVEASLRGDTADFHCELRMRHSEGHWVWVLHQGMVVERHSSIQCGRVIGTTQDVTRRKDAELALLLSQQHRQLAMNSAQLGQWQWRLEDDLLALDARCAEMFGFAAEEMTLSRSDWARLVDADDVAAIHACIDPGRREGPDNFAMEHRHAHPRRGWIWLQVHGQVIRRDPAGTPLHIVGLYQEVTDVKAAEQELRAARDKAEGANRAKSAFLANMSHEIRTPMNAMIGLTRLVLEADLRPRERDFLQKVQASSMSLLAILNDILDLSKIEAGQMRTASTPFSPEAVLKAAVQLFEQQAQDKSIGLQLECGPMPSRMLGDPARLAQVLRNLLGNAIKFTAQGQVRLVADLQQDDTGCTVLRCAVHDTGIGLSQAQQAALFRPFSQADETVTRRYGGTGLGLAISRQLVNLMGGDIGCEGELGVGCTFTFTVRLKPDAPMLPAHAAAPEVPGIERSPVTAASRRFDGRRVLLVDDNPLNREVAGEILRGVGMDVTEAEDGAQAVHLMATEHWHLVLMDLHMPVLDGLSAMHELAALPASHRPPVVALTASVMEEDRLRCAQAGMADFIAKPVDVDSLGRVLAQWVPAGDGAAVVPLAPADTGSTRSGQAVSRRDESGQPASAEVRIDVHAEAGAIEALRHLLHEHELVPDDLLEFIRARAEGESADARWTQLMKLIFDFDHAGALSVLDTLSSKSP